MVRRIAAASQPSITGLLVTPFGLLHGPRIVRSSVVGPDTLPTDLFGDANPFQDSLSGVGECFNWQWTGGVTGEFQATSLNKYNHASQKHSEEAATTTHDFANKNSCQRTESICYI